MKQVIQSYKTGKLELADVPVPRPPANAVLVKNAASIVSIGTERSIIDLGRMSLLGKARARPDLVRRVLEKAKNEGVLKTIQEALGRLDSPTPLGYSSAGTVVEVGAGVHQFAPGDRVACIGAGYAAHADFVAVPANLCAPVPPGVELEEAAFGMLGIIALHGVRCTEATFGATVAVTGLGLLGLLAIQILRAYGCSVVGFDPAADKVELARRLGLGEVYASIGEFKRAVERVTGGHGVDAVLVTASTRSDEPVNTGVEIVKFGGRIVLTGVADVHPDRNELWHKEVQLVVSRAGGPGLLDPVYENRGIDYPFGYVRWTENRNLGEFLSLLAQRKVDVRSLISARYPIDRALEAYDAILGRRDSSPIGVVLEYEAAAPASVGRRSIGLRTGADRSVTHPAGIVRAGVIGGGLFGKAVFLPVLSRTPGIDLRRLSTSQSATALHTARKFGFAGTTTDYREVLAEPDIDAVLILTPHRTHAAMVLEAIARDKHVFVEKPLCVDETELHAIHDACTGRVGAPGRYLMVGYNRKFSPHTEKIRDFVADRHDPLVISYRVNAGHVPKAHWVHAEEEGGSRIVGEICHFVDWIMCVTGSRPVRVYAERVSGNDRTVVNSDNVVITLKLDDGSIGTILYCAQGDRAVPRERIEVYSEGGLAVCTDFRETVLYRCGRRTFRTWGQQLGYAQELAHFRDAVAGCAERIPFGDLYLSTLTVFKITDSLQRGRPVEVPSFPPPASTSSTAEADRAADHTPDHTQ